MKKSIFTVMAAMIAASSAQAAKPELTFLIQLDEARTPIGWAQFCREHTEACNVPALPAQVVTLTDRTWHELAVVNSSVNRDVQAMTDPDHWHVAENWAYPIDGKGDCEDFVLEKRRRLIAAGWPRQALLITVVRDTNGDGHAVLIVKTDRGDFSLDNLERQIKLWSETGYSYVKQQSPENPNRWMGLGNIDTQLFTAK